MFNVVEIQLRVHCSVFVMNRVVGSSTRRGKKSVIESQRLIWNPFEHLRSSFFVKIVNGILAVTYFRKKTLL